MPAIKIAKLPNKIRIPLGLVSNESKLFSWIPNVEIINAGKTTDNKIMLIIISEKTEIIIVKILFFALNSDNISFYFWLQLLQLLVLQSTFQC